MPGTPGLRLGRLTAAQSGIAQHQRQENVVGPERVIRDYVRPDTVVCNCPADRVDASLVGDADRPARCSGDAHLHGKPDRDVVLLPEKYVQIY